MNSVRPYPGVFLTIEGGEGAGKSSLALQLQQSLKKRGRALLATRDPGGSLLAEKIRALLLLRSEEPITDRAELMLFLAARVQNMEQLILPTLHRGIWVLCERFHDSTIAYQGAARHLGMSYVEQLCQWVCGALCPGPDLTFLLDIDPEEGLSRVKASRGRALDRIEEELLPFHREVRQGFLHLADLYPERIHLLDATQSSDRLVSQALEILDQRFLYRA